MRFRSLVIASLGLAATVFGERGADASAPTYAQVTFTAVTSYITQPTVSSQTQYGVTITGIQTGQSAASTVSFATMSAGGGIQGNSPATVVAESCERQLLVMLNRPGRFSLGMVLNQTSVTLPVPTGTGPLEVIGCSLTQQP
jgi:hypothetical protein